jgi:hypothetical protein
MEGSRGHGRGRSGKARSVGVCMERIACKRGGHDAWRMHACACEWVTLTLSAFCSSSSALCMTAPLGSCPLMMHPLQTLSSASPEEAHTLRMEQLLFW